MLTGLVVGMLIPSNDPALFKSVMSLFEATMLLLILHRKTGNAGQSPFVLVFNRVGVKSSCMSPLKNLSLSFRLFSSTSHCKCCGPDERFLICEWHVVLGLEVAVCTRCARASSEICDHSL